MTGWVFYNPLTEQIVLFPDERAERGVDGSRPRGHAPYDESITFSSGGGREHQRRHRPVVPHRTERSRPRLYGRFRLNDLSMLSDGYMRNTVREAFNDVASKLPVQDIYGAGKSRMLADVTQKCRDVFGKDGIIIDQLTINGALRLPQNVMDAINRAMEATQNAIQSRNRVAQVEAEATQAITQAHGAGRSRAAEGPGRRRRAAHPRARRGAGQRDHPPVDHAGGPAVPGDRALGRQAAGVQRGRPAHAHLRL